jgi:hypothetical protein
MGDKIWRLSIVPNATQPSYSKMALDVGIMERRFSVGYVGIARSGFLKKTLIGYHEKSLTSHLITKAPHFLITV